MNSSLRKHKLRQQRLLGAAILRARHCGKNIPADGIPAALIVNLIASSARARGHTLRIPAKADGARAGNEHGTRRCAMRRIEGGSLIAHEPVWALIAA